MIGNTSQLLQASCDTQQSRTIEMTPQSKFPTLSLSVLCNSVKENKSIEANSPVPIPFETDLFRGQLLLLIRASNNGNKQDDAYHGKIFDGKKRTLEFQVQGRFKRVPSGKLFMGIEITEQMKLGLVTKGLCSMLLSFMQRLAAEIHFSFGDSRNTEYPHIVFPLKNIDRLVVTKDGETPPKLGSVIEETEESIAKRKSLHANDKYGEWTVTDTYTMSFNTMYVDLLKWQVVNVPIMKDMDLRTFWGESPLRMVAYEVNRTPEVPGKSTDVYNKENGKPFRGIEKHEQKSLNYIFCAQAKYLPEGLSPVDPGRADESFVPHRADSAHSLPWEVALPSRCRSIEPAQDLEQPIKVSSASISFPVSEDDLSSDIGSDGYQSESSTEQTQTADDETVYFDADDRSVFDSDFAALTTLPSRPRRASWSSLDFDLFPPNRLFPGWVDFCDRGGHYTRLYALVASQKEILFISAKEFYTCFGRVFTLPPSGSRWSSRLSHSERLRRRMGHIFSFTCQTLPSDELEGCLLKLRNVSSSRYGKSYLSKESKNGTTGTVRATSKSPFKKRVPLTSFQGFLARAASERHWVEQLATVTSSHVCFYHPDRKRPSFRICLQSIINVKCLQHKDDVDSPCFPLFHFSAIETLGRTVYCMHATAAQRSRWVESISSIIASMHGCSNLHEQGDDAWQSIMHTPDDPAQEYLHCSSLWSCNGRRILNCKKFPFGDTTSKQIADTPADHPCELVEQLLRKALAMNAESSNRSMCTFLDGVADLKLVDLSKLGEGERKVFFINLYHVMIMHAFMVLGPPRSSFEWISFFNMISYQCSDDIFSLAELEHRIIRFRMSTPSNFVSKVVLPKSDYNFALKEADFRLNFALNCGSLSNPPNVIIFSSKNLNDQLDAAARLYLESSVLISKSKKGITVTLPRVCDWYQNDFGKRQNVDVVRVLYQYFPEHVQAAISPFLDLGVKGISVKFASYDFHCRFLSLQG